MCKELGDKMIASDSLEGLACISGAEGGAERAATLFGVAGALRETIGAVAYQHSPEVEAWLEPYLEAARSSLKEASWEAAWTEGQGMTLEKGVEYALSEEEPTSPISPASKRLLDDEPPALTRREREVATLVAHGLSNAQIAKDLFISEHTVHHHITKILKKLKLSSRQQVASRLSDR